METKLRESILIILKSNRDDLKRFGVESISLFGSVARGDAGPGSDVDLLVYVERGTTLFGLSRLKHHLEDLLGRPVDLVTPDGLRPQMRQSILAEAICA